MPDLFSRPGSDNPKGSRDLFARPKTKKPRGNEPPSQEDLAALQAKAEETGATSFLPTARQAGGAVIDLLSRPNYAMAALLSEGPAAAGRELFSGIGGLEGRKRGFGQVMEEAGVGPGVSFSDLMPFLYSETGEGAALQRGGPLDPTGRGVAGLALDVFLDPTTYIGVGAAAKLGKAGALSGKGFRAYKTAVKEALPTVGGALDIAKAPKPVVLAAVSAEKAADAARAIVPRGTQEVLSSGLKVGSEGYKAARKAGLDMAEDRIAAAIKAGATDYLSEGGIRWAGWTIPGTPRMATATSGMTGRMVEKLASGGAGPHVQEFVGGMKKMKDAVLGTFIKGHGIRNLEGAMDLLRENYDATGYLRHLMDEDIASSPLAKYIDMKPAERSAKFKEAVDAYERGGIAAVKPELRDDFIYFANKMKEIENAELKSGLVYVRSFSNQVEISEKITKVENELASKLDTLAKEEKKALSAGPYESKSLMSPDEANYFRRRGWHVIDEGDGKYKAYKLVGETRINEIEAARQAAQLSASKRILDLADSTKVGHQIRSRENYFAHFYDNDPDELTKVVYAKRGESTKIITNRHAEERVFDTLADAEEYSKTQHAGNPNIPILKPIYDPLEVLRRRWETSINNRMNKDLVERAEAKFGKLPFDVQRIYDLTPPQKVKLSATQFKEYNAIQKAVAAGKTDPAWIATLSDEGKQEFFRERFLKAKSRPELNAILEKYGDPIGKHDLSKYFPKGLLKEGELAPDGSIYRKYNFGRATEAVLPQSLGDEIVGFNEKVVKSQAARSLIDGYDKAMSFWKGSMTAIWPAFHARNAISNVAQSFLDIGAAAINPRYWLENRRVMNVKEGVFTAANGAAYTYDELRTMMKQHGVLTTERALFETTGRAAGAKGPGKIFERGRKIGGGIENSARADLFLNNMRRGLSPEAAGAKVNEFLFDYEHGLTNVERRYLKRLFPFYTWQRLNLGLQAKALATKPGLLAAEIKPFRGRQDENEMLTSWDAGALKLRLNRDGRTVSMMTGIDLPIRNLDMLWRGSAQKTLSGLAGMLAPPLKQAIELTTGTDLFLDRPMSRKESKLVGRAIQYTPKAIQDFLGYKAEPDDAGRIHHRFDGRRFSLIFQSWVLSRVISTSDRQFRMYLDPQKWDLGSAMLNVLTGFQLKNVNLDEEMKKKIAQRTKEIQESLIRRGEGRQFQRYYEPKPK